MTIVGVVIAAWLANRNGRAQKRLERKHEVFTGATAVLAALLTDALDAKLQSEKPTWRGMSRRVELRPETVQALGHSRGMVDAFFSDEVFHKFDLATRAEVSLANIPNNDFDEKRDAFVAAASAELGLKERNDDGSTQENHDADPHADRR